MSEGGDADVEGAVVMGVRVGACIVEGPGEGAGMHGLRGGDDTRRLHGSCGPKV
jgi:hypothetical protein